MNKTNKNIDRFTAGMRYIDIGVYVSETFNPLGDETMNEEAQVTAETIRRMSENNRWDDPKKAARFLVDSVFREEALAACDIVLADDSWSQDRQPYQWLEDVKSAILAMP